MSTPPRNGARIGATSPGQTRIAITLMIPSRGVTRRTASRPTGTIRAPPTPCSTRAPTSSGRVGLRAQSSEARVKTAIARVKIRRTPNRSLSHPDAGMSTATVRRNAVTVIATDAESTPRSSAIAGAAVVTMVASRFSMK